MVLSPEERSGQSEVAFPEEKPPAETETDVWGYARARPGLKERKHLKKAQRTARNDVQYFGGERPPPALVSIGRFQLHQNEHPDHGPECSYLDCLSIHAQLYVFADQYRIDDLMQLTTKKLRQALSAFRYYNQRAADIAGLAEFVYDNTPKHVTHNDRLREVVVDSIASNFEDLMEISEFRQLIGRGGDLVIDIGRKVTQRLVKTQDKPNSGVRYWQC